MAGGCSADMAELNEDWIIALTGHWAISAHCINCKSLEMVRTDDREQYYCIYYRIVSSLFLPGSVGQQENAPVPSNCRWRREGPPEVRP